jgi:hypothetical protein
LLIVPEKQLVCVFKWPNHDFKAWEIYKLTISNVFNIKNNRYKGTLINRIVIYLKKKGSQKDYLTIIT